MASDRLSRVLDELSAAHGGGTSAQLCEATRDVLGVSGAGIMLMSGDAPRGSLCATNDVSNLIEELQYTLGEGPCVDAHRENRIVIESDLLHPNVPRWLAFSPEATDAGVRAVFAFPLQVGTVRLGALDLYLDEPGVLTDDQHADAIVMAGVIAQWVLDVQSNAPKGSVADQLEADANFHYVVHNAAGVVSVQLGVSVADALIRLRAYAFSNGRPLRDVAADVVNRRIRF